VNGKFKGFSADDLLAVADRFAIGSAPRGIGQVREAVKAWPAFAAAAGLSAQQCGHIGSQHLLQQRAQQTPMGRCCRAGPQPPPRGAPSWLSCKWRGRWRDAAEACALRLHQDAAIFNAAYDDGAFSG